MRPRAQSSRLQPQHDGLLAESKHQPEAQLVLAILQQAILDARDGDQDAYRFLTDETGKWAASRADLAWAVNCDPDNLRRNVIKAITPPAADQPQRAKVSTFVPVKSPRMRDQILDALATIGGQPIHVRDLAPLIGRDKDSTAATLWSMTREGLAEKVAPATFRLKTSFSEAA